MSAFVKMVVAIIVIIAASIGVFYIEGKTKSARVANITIFIENQNESVNITDVEGNLERFSKTSLPPEGTLVAPGIAVRLIQDMTPVSGWGYLPLNGSGTYNLKIGLDDSFSEDKVAKVYVQAIDSSSNEIISGQKKILLKTSPNN